MERHAAAVPTDSSISRQCLPLFDEARQTRFSTDAAGLPTPPLKQTGRVLHHLESLVRLMLCQQAPPLEITKSVAFSLLGSICPTHTSPKFSAYKVLIVCKKRVQMIKETKNKNIYKTILVARQNVARISR